jgi:hypothetical protein
MSKALARAATGDCPSDELLEAISRTSSLLSEALTIADSKDFPPEIGARLEELIERVQQELADRKFARAILAAWGVADAFED